MTDFLKQEVTVTNKLGLHARAASQFVKLAGQFSSEIAVERDGVRTNGKSIMGILMLAAPKGSRLVILARGEDASMALTALTELVQHGFYEE